VAPPGGDAVGFVVSEVVPDDSPEEVAVPLSAQLADGEPLPPQGGDVVAEGDCGPLRVGVGEVQPLGERAPLDDGKPVPDRAPDKLRNDDGVLHPECTGTPLALALPDAERRGVGDCEVHCECAAVGDVCEEPLSLALPGARDGEGGPLALAARSPVGEALALLPTTKPPLPVGSREREGGSDVVPLTE